VHALAQRALSKAEKGKQAGEQAGRHTQTTIDDRLEISLAEKGS